ncbi:class I SAM-dependent RNA methyltransferase [Ginsengibacter hankyongi]|uniref:Class I SAM-dependent RNA methyltransferase n=1 Tax=Ginsengibacter hankyongi TaxID=2607284 RepID=A0A5J5IHX5_9BACT|nr:class I SAM-dependent RNA methyltransferase [Ginsengibacter hankyongi]KAA9039283.1 class I SAM-dependent RNA methyltransferase [Ginsengibacter hankyongi]
MQLFNKASRIVITCNKRLAPFLQKEIEELGFKILTTFSTGVEIPGTLNDCIKLNLNLRCASQVLYSIQSFSCNGPAELYDSTTKIDWENIFSKDGYFSVTSTVDHPTINNSLFANVKVKDAIVDRFREKINIRPNSGPDLNNTVIHLYWKNDIAEIFIDTSGETLAKHGYRKIPGKAPMLEALVAATLLATKWDRRSAFINPMCGSSTIAIEAALLATNRRPGLIRNNYGFKHILGFDEKVFENEKRKLIDQIIDLPELKIIASDISPDAINISKINAGAAGVENLIEFEVCDFKETKIPENEAGVIYFNPEYGERLGDETELTHTYAEIGDFMKKKCKGYTGYIFTGNLELAKKIGLKAKRRIEFYTSKIDCRLLEYDLYPGTKRIDATVS